MLELRFVFRNLRPQKVGKHTFLVPGCNSSDTVIVDRAVETSDSLSHKAFIIATYRGMFRLCMIDIVSATLTIYNIVLARGCLSITNNDMCPVRISTVFLGQEPALYDMVICKRSNGVFQREQNKLMFIIFPFV